MMVPIIYNLRSLRVRKTTTLVTALGIGLVVFVLASALMLSAGIERTMAVGGSPDVAIVLRKGSDGELASQIDVTNVSLVLASPAVRRDASGQGEGVGEIIVVAALEKLGTDGMANVALRGVPPEVFSFRPDVRVTRGRAAKSGTDEVIVGRAIANRFKGLTLGGTFGLSRDRKATVVGIFEDAGSAYESEVWADIDTVRSAFGRQGIVSSVRARLQSPARFNAFEASVEQNKQLGLEAMQEPDFYRKQSEDTSTFMMVLGSMIAVFFAVGAMIGAMITMYSAIANRKRELGAMRALGFSRSSILLSILVESFILALLGGSLGCLAALLMGLVEFSMMNFATWSEIVFSFHPTLEIMATAMAAAGVMGLLGGMVPAIRAARTSPTEAMRH